MRIMEGLTDLLLDPVPAAVPANLVNLEPFGGPGVKFIARRRPARGQIGQEWTWGVRAGD